MTCTLLKLRGLDSFSDLELKKFRENYDPKKDAPKILGVNISTSNVCNLNCIYCCAGSKKVPLSNELTIGEQQSIISQAKQLGAKTVVVCGDGEPTMDNKLCKIVTHANKLGMITVIFTNGVIFEDNKVSNAVHGYNGDKLLELFYESNVSLIIKVDSLKEERYDTIVGKPNSFKKLMKAIGKIRKVGFTKIIQRDNSYITRLSFATVVMKHNIEELANLKNFADSIGAQFVSKLPSLVGNTLNNIPKMFKVSDYENIRKHLLNYTAKRETLMVDSLKCMAWYYGPTFDCKGEVRECYTSPCPENRRIGNIRENTLYELVKKRNQLYDITANDSCPVKTRINNELLSKGFQKI